MQPNRKNYKSTHATAYPSLFFGFKCAIAMCIIGALMTLVHSVTGEGMATLVVWLVVCWPVIFANMLFAILTELGIRFADGNVYVFISYISQAVGWFVLAALWYKLIGYKYFGAKEKSRQSNI